MGDWLKAVQSKEARLAELDAKLIPVVEQLTHSGGRTPGVMLACGSHSTGWLTFLRIEGEVVKIDYRRERDDIPLGSCKVIVLGERQRAGSVRVKCADCEREHVRDEVALLVEIVKALASKTRRGSRKFVRMDSMP